MLDSETLEIAAQKLEGLHANPTYEQAWRKAAKVIRGLKPKILINEAPAPLLIDGSEQISSSSSRPVGA